MSTPDESIIPDEYAPEEPVASEEYETQWPEPSLEVDLVDREEQTVEVEVVEDFPDEDEG